MASQQNHVKQYKCRFCPALFLTTQALVRHNNVHKSEKLQEKYQAASNLPAKPIILPHSPVQAAKRPKVGGRSCAGFNLQLSSPFPYQHANGEKRELSSEFTGMAQRSELQNLETAPGICRDVNSSYPAIPRFDTLGFELPELTVEEQNLMYNLVTNYPLKNQEQLSHDMQHFVPLDSSNNLNFKDGSHHVQQQVDHKFLSSSTRSLHIVRQRKAEQLRQKDQTFQSFQNVLINPSPQFQQQMVNSSESSLHKAQHFQEPVHDSQITQKDFVICSQQFQQPQVNSSSSGSLQSLVWPSEEQFQKLDQNFQPLSSEKITCPQRLQQQLMNPSSSDSLHSVVVRGAEEFQKMDQNSRTAATQNILRSCPQQRNQSSLLAFNEVLNLDWQEIVEYLGRNPRAYK